ncbi:T9SS type A sorting domain-containing protein [Lacinutrix sp. WUR7]|uniref:T9SS type A sorting domain-containing protein n=1 Tax=Lacinutrix sp. WUR7 TaxID=2653681 RepID=UPI00193E1CB8|nr:T9SS type A sorting domain-containing protein [Lacinutrix sp. WUR7]QRM89960.1 T9SS type A sorting domain-containing protein [Lacinutrix sp. WUR7]
MKLKLLFALFFYAHVTLAQIAAPPVPETWENDLWFSNQWMHFSTVNYTFNVDCLPNLAVSQVLDFGSGIFVNSSRLTISYNGNNQVVETINELWNSVNAAWENDRRSTQAYDGNNLTEILHYLWINNAWLLEYRIVNAYNGSLLTESITQQWDINASQWINDIKSEFTYNSIPLLEIALSSAWSTVDNVWINDGRTTFVYDANNLLNIKTFEDWESNAWVNDRQETYTFDSNDFLIESLVSEWNTSTMVYDLDRRETYTNNAQGYYTELVRENYLLGSWVNETRDRRTYPICYTLGVENLLAEGVLVYPIPAQNVLHIKSNMQHSEAIIMDLNGRIVQQEKLTNALQTIDISQLNSGVYILKLSNGNQVITEKIIKK